MLAGIVTNLRGASKFYVKDSKGNVKELKVGDEISQNSVIVASGQKGSNISVELNNTDIIVLRSNQGQLIDSSLNAKNFKNEEFAFNQKSLQNIASNQEDVTDIETAAGEDPTDMQTDAGIDTEAKSERVVARFDERDGDSVDITSDLRDTSLSGIDFADAEYFIPAELLNPQETITLIEQEPIISTEQEPVTTMITLNGRSNGSTVQAGFLLKMEHYC